MATNNKTLYLIASKLGIQDKDRVLGKAAEFLRLLQIKSTAGSNITNTGNGDVVLCLDLAADLLGIDLDKKMAIKYSGMKPAMYTNSRKVIQKLLELDTEKLTTSVVCAALQCMGVKDLADRLLVKYQEQARMEVDLNLPQYVCMAVYHACRLNRVKISKSKLAEKSRLKPAQWNQLNEVWTAFVDNNFSPKKKNNSPKNPIEIVESQKNNIEQKKEQVKEPEMEPYEVWKARTLKMAYEELREAKRQEQLEAKKAVMRMENELTPRRSPRKTPQKNSPFQSLTDKKGVRLLFPAN